MEAINDIILRFDGNLYLRIASTKEEAEAKVFAKTLVAALTPLLKDGVTLEVTTRTSRFKTEEK